MILYEAYPGYTHDCPRCNFKAYKNKCDNLYKVKAVIIDDVNRKKRLKFRYD